MRGTSIPHQRSRPFYAFVAMLVVATGLLWRSRLLSLPVFVAKYGGDALWGLLVFLGFGFLLCRSSTARVALFAIGFATSVELLQLFHADWIDAIRSTRLGHLVLGSTFNGPDLLAYAFGIGLGAFAERACLRANAGSNRKV